MDASSFGGEGDRSVLEFVEWVRFTNAGTEAIDLDGWEVADESASHRYSFNDLHLDPGAEVTLFSGCGPDDETARYWCVSGSAVWISSGDTVFPPRSQREHCRAAVVRRVWLSTGVYAGNP